MQMNLNTSAARAGKKLQNSILGAQLLTCLLHLLQFIDCDDIFSIISKSVSFKPSADVRQTGHVWLPFADQVRLMQSSQNLVKLEQDETDLFSILGD